MNNTLINKRILVTGQSGFIGTNLFRLWNNFTNLVPVSFTNIEIDKIPVSKGDVIIHLAGIAHQHKIAPELYYEVNYKKATAFAISAKEKGASHFIFVSTTKVYGDNLQGIIKESSLCQPTDDYGKSKLLAEKEISQLQDEDFTVAILRPPLVYGAGVKGNMLKLLQLCATGKPLPFIGVNNERSIVYVGNLMAMIEQIIANKKGGVFIPSDDKPLSTFSMLQMMKELFGTKNLEIAVPSWMVKIVSMVSPALSKKVFGSLVFDNTASRQTLGFTNPYTTRQGFEEMVLWFIKNNKY